MQNESTGEQKSLKTSSLLALSALGVVYGDIGTSPLYAFKESLHHTHNIGVLPENIFGILSLIFWSLIIVISVKYLIYIVRADNQGEGGVLALTALLSTLSFKSKQSLRTLTLLGLFGTALLYGDGMITPAISVLSAVEGLELVTPLFHPYILHITVAILVALFSIQQYGTSAVGKVFGPITLTWFLVIAILGLNKIVQAPEVLRAINPQYALEFFIINKWNGFVVLGSVFLVVTGGEALYSDLGHFGKSPVRLAWFTIVLPALLLNYFGQGALLLQNPAAIKNPFYLLAPEWALIPLVILATLATVIASQALITGVFSLTMQSVQLHYSPRVTIDHTSKEHFGQIYVPSVNKLLMFACITLVLTFKSSSNLAAAYGIAVTTTMVITTILFYFVLRYSWNWGIVKAGTLCGFFLAIELSFWSANVLKILKGGWFPLVVGLVIFIIMTTWHRGRQILSSRMLEITVPLHQFLAQLKIDSPHRVPGIAVYMAGYPQYAPPALIQSLKHFKSIHENLIFLFVQTLENAHVSNENRVKIENLGPQINKITISYGFMELPNIPQALDGLKVDDLVFNSKDATYFLGREQLMATKRQGMAIWREKLFAIMSHNAQTATEFFQLPSDRVVEIRSVIEL